MAIVNRNGRSYLYKSVRKGGKVTSRYVAGGRTALLLARIEAMEKEAAEAKEAARKARELVEREPLDAVESEINAVVRSALEAVAADLESRGFRRHARGEWRRRRR